VSTDTKFVHLAWKQDEKMLEKVKYTMGSDPNARLSKLFGVYDKEAGLDLRGTFIISPEGKLMNSEVNFFNLGRNVEEIVRKVKANAYLYAHQNEGCPAKWQKDGDKTLKPSAQLVGKVFEALA
jgi:peroxiredoxin (alkyl hydroperoxide reductase subunit C)